jgi:hypothetical protein
MMLVHIDESMLMHGTCWFRLLVQVVWCKLIGTSCLVQVNWYKLL